MKTPWSILVVLALGIGSTARAQTCTTIQEGGLVDAKGNPIALGYDQFGYNYEAHMFNGPYDCFARDVTACDAADPDHQLVMKWNDAWLASTDCNGDGRLDRPTDPNYTVSAKGSGAWVTNHETGKVWVTDAKGVQKLKTFTYSAKIVAVPIDAVLAGGEFFTAEGQRIGWAIWGDYAVTEEVYNDPSNGAHGVLYKGLPGLGNLP